jgi:hypothetical protein
MTEERQKHDAESTGTIMIEWKLFAQLYCVPGEMGEAEELAFVREVKDLLGPDFDACPDEFIADRLVGGVRCPFNDERRHVMHNGTWYSYLSAGRGSYWALSERDKAEMRREYEQSVTEYDLWVGDGPFTDRRET